MAGAAYRRVVPRPLVTDGDMSSDFQSEWIDVAGLNQITIHYKWTGVDPIGSVKIQADVSENPHKTPITYDVPLSPTIDIDSNSGEDSIVLTGPLSRWRLIWDSTSGSGTFNAYWQGHQV